MSKPQPAPKPIIDQTTSADIKRAAHITLDSPVEYVRQQMGVPQKEFTDAPYTDMVYAYDDYMLVVSTKDGHTISTLDYLLKDKNKRIPVIAKTNTPHLILGEAAFGDYADRCGRLTRDTYGKVARFYCDVTFGQAGNYWRYRLGSHDDAAFVRKLSSDPELSRSLFNEGAIAKQRLNFVSIARGTTDLDMFYSDEF